MTTEAQVPAAAEPAIATSGAGEIVLPQVIVDAGPQAVGRFLEFFAGRIANARTRAAYGRAVGQFLGWCEARGLGLRDVSPLHVAAYIRTHPGSVPTVKQHLAAIRMLGDWLVVSQVLPVNPAAAVRDPKHVVTKGATPVLSPAEARKLLESIDTGALAELRDRALLSVMLYSFARVSAVLGMRRQDYFGQGSRGWLRSTRRAGSGTTFRRTNRVAAALDAYVKAGGLEEPKAALFQTVDPAGRWLTGRALARRLVLAMIKRRAAAAGLPPPTCCHTSGRRGSRRTCRTEERSSARSRSRARLAEDDEALRPNGGHGDGRRDRAHRDLNGSTLRSASQPRPPDGSAGRIRYREGSAARGLEVESGSASSSSES